MSRNWQNPDLYDGATAVCKNCGDDITPTRNGTECDACQKHRKLHGTARHRTEAEREIGRLARAHTRRRRQNRATQ